MVDKPPPKRRKPQLTPALESAIEKAKEYERDASKTELEKRYAIGKLAKDVQDDPEKYGKRGMLRLANALGRDKSTLFRAATIAKHWDSAAFRRLKGRAAPNGIGITWSHLELVAKRKKRSERDVLLNRIVEEGLSVRALKSEFRKKLSGAATIAKAIQDAAKMVGRIERMIGRLPERLAADNAGDDPMVKNAIKALRGGLRKLRTSTKTVWAPSARHPRRQSRDVPTPLMVAHPVANRA